MTNIGEAILSVRDLEVRRDDFVLSRFDLDLHSGEIVALLGPNGAGKSSALWSLSGLLPTYRGEIRLDGRRIDRLAPNKIARLGVAHVLQGRRLFAQLTVRENIEMGKFACRDGVVPDEVDVWFGRFGELRQLSDVKAGLLSGGQQQIVAIVRSLIAHPRVVLLDEPTASLSSAMRARFLEEFQRLARMGTALLVVEQEVEAILSVADRSVVMRAGNVLTQ